MSSWYFSGPATSVLSPGARCYGLSARGIAIDTGFPSGEEFPFFKEFWIVKPGLYDKQTTVYALLDSPSLTGAYRYVIKPGKETRFRSDQ